LQLQAPGLGDHFAGGLVLVAGATFGLASSSLVEVREFAVTFRHHRLEGGVEASENSSLVQTQRTGTKARQAPTFVESTYTPAASEWSGTSRFPSTWKETACP